MSERGTPETDAGYKAHYAEHENNVALTGRPLDAGNRDDL